MDSFNDTIRALTAIHEREVREVRRDAVRKLADRAVGELIQQPHIKSRMGKDFAYHAARVLFDSIGEITEIDGDEWLSDASELIDLGLTLNEITDRLIAKFL